MKIFKNKARIVFFLIFLIAVVLICIFYNICREYKKHHEGVFVRYDQTLMSSNASYVGIIEIENQKVIILDKTGKEVSVLNIKEQYPNQIAMGNKSYFLLYRWEDKRGAGRVVQYDYQSNKLNECVISDIATIGYRNGYLFIGDWLYVGADNLFEHNAFYANRYIEEEHFGEQLKKISRKYKWGCNVGDVKMYYHEQGYFSTDPVWNDYPGASMDDFRNEDSDWNYRAETEQEMINRSSLLKAIDNTTSQSQIYSIYEYQSGNDIYGVCNVLKQYKPALPLKSEDVIKSYCYNIKKEDNRAYITDQDNSCIAIITDGATHVFQKGNIVISRNNRTGNEKNIYEFQENYSSTIYVQDEYLLIQEKDKYSFVKWIIP